MNSFGEGPDRRRRIARMRPRVSTARRPPQLLTCLRNREGNHPSGPRHEGILLYAAVDRSFRIDVEL